MGSRRQWRKPRGRRSKVSTLGTCIFFDPVGISLPTVPSFPSFPLPPVSTQTIMRNFRFANLNIRYILKAMILFSFSCLVPVAEGQILLLSPPPSSSFTYIDYMIDNYIAVLWLIKLRLNNLESCFLSVSWFSLVLPFFCYLGSKILSFIVRIHSVFQNLVILF